MPDAPAAGGLVELTAGELRLEHIGRVLQIPAPPTTGVLLELEHHVDPPPLPGMGVVMRDATRLLLDLPRRDRGPGHPDPLPVHLLPSVRVVVDLALEVGVCALCGQELLRTTTDCWHPWTVERACPPEPPLHQWPAGFRSGRPGRDQWRHRPIPTEESPS